MKKWKVSGGFLIGSNLILLGTDVCFLFLRKILLYLKAFWDIIFIKAPEANPFFSTDVFKGYICGV